MCQRIPFFKLAPALLLTQWVLLAGPASAAKVYWADHGTRTISRANDDGTGMEVVVANAGAGHTLAIDVPGRALYWTGSLAGSGIYRSNLDGSGIVKILGTESIEGLAVDHDLGRLYWSESSNEHVFSARLDGSDVRMLAGLDQSHSLSVDPEDGCLYLEQNQSIFRLAADDASTCVPPYVFDHDVVGIIWGVAAAPNGRQLYWSQSDGNLSRNEGGFGLISRVGLDGATPEVLVASPVGGADAFAVRGIAVDELNGKLYWTDVTGFYDVAGGIFTTPRIRRANLDGSSIEDLGIAGLLFPDAIVVDPIPEPCSIVLMAIGFTFLLALLGRKRFRAGR